MSWQPENADKWIKEGISHYNAKRYNACLDACERAIQLDPDCARAYHGKGLALAQEIRYGEALKAYQKASQLAPENAKIHAEMAELFYKKGDYETSGSTCRRAIQLDSQYEAVYREKLKMLLDKAFKLNTPNMPDLAISAFHDVLLFNPDNAIALAEIEKIQKEKEGLKSGSKCYTGTMVYTKDANSVSIYLCSYQSSEEVRIFLVELKNGKYIQKYEEHSLQYFSKTAYGWKISFPFPLRETAFRVEVLLNEAVIAYGYYCCWIEKGYLGRYAEHKNIHLTIAYNPPRRLSEGGGNNSIIYAPGRTGGRNRRARRG